MESKDKMVTEARLFVRLGLLSFAGFAFYYAHLFFGLLNNVVLFKALAITFLLATIPLPIIAVNHEVVSPRDPASGLPTGKRQHKPFTFVAELDRTFPFWQQALSRNDTIKTMKFDFGSVRFSV